MRVYWITGVLGVALMAAPYVFQYSTDTIALTTAVLAGFGVLAASVFEATADDREEWEYWIAGLLGFTALIVPFIFGFTMQGVMTWTIVTIAALIVAAAVGRLYMHLPKTHIWH